MRKYYFLGNDDAHRWNVAEIPLASDPQTHFAGWHPTEVWGCWAAEREAQLKFSINQESGSKVTLFILLHIPPGSTNTACVISVGGVQNFLTNLTEHASWHSVKGTVSKNNTIDITFLSSGDFGKPDNRNLYIGIHSLVLCANSDMATRAFFLWKSFVAPLTRPSRENGGNRSSNDSNTPVEEGDNRSEQQVEVLEDHVVHYTPSLNVRLLNTRNHISELLSDLEKKKRYWSPQLSMAGDSNIQLLENTYESLTAFLRDLNLPVDAQPEDPFGAGTVRQSSEQITIVFDVSDLIQFFRHHRLPTGIQRVQIEAISVALLKNDPAFNVKVCCFQETDDYWRPLAAADFMTLCELSLVSNDWTASDWREAMAGVEASLRQSSDFVFPKGAYLVNIGTSWWLQNYFLHIREAKRKASIHYVPFVHDMIPIMTPEHCVLGLTQDFVCWALGVFLHADYFFVNSEATRKDLLEVAEKLGYKVDNTHVHTIRLDADYRKNSNVPLALSTALQTHRLVPRGYVLFVSTIESRKNHLAAFNAWQRLIKKYGNRNIPKLVCVGIRGWLNDQVFAKLAADTELRDKVVMLSGVPDADLALLYQNCLFTIYPSFYEGWGLPVTESLCYGKVPLISNSSSLPEAGGAFAEYFDLDVASQLDEALERLIFNEGYLQKRELLIQQEFHPRSWAEVSDEIVSTIGGWAEAMFVRRFDNNKIIAPSVTIGRYYPISRITDTRLYRSMISGEIFRVGNGWWGCEDWGCWLKPGPARMVMRIDGNEGLHRLYLGLRGVPNKRTPFDVAVLGYESTRGVAEVGKVKWVTLDLEINAASGTELEIVLEGYERGNEKPREDIEARPVALGVIGFMLCRADDILTRSNFVEAVALDTLDHLARRVPESE